MKLMKRIFCLSITLALVGVLVTSCEREIIIEDDVEGVKAGENDIEIEFATFEEINQAFIDNGLEPLNFSNYTKTSICNILAPTLNSCKCNSNVVAIRGDINQDNVLCVKDLVLANRVKNGIDPPNQYTDLAGGIKTLKSVRFGCSSSDGPITLADIDIMTFTILDCDC